MKHKKQDQTNFEESEQNTISVHDDNGLNGTTNGHYSEEDKEKGNLKAFNISKKTIKKLKACNIEYLYPVQRESFASIYEKNDCIIQASSGSGKTLAFVIPIVELLQNDKSIELESGRAPRALVVAPTRDIIKGISENFESIASNLVVATIFNIKKKSEDQETVIANGCDILVATPDRLQEFIENEKVDLSQINHVVLDDVDSMLDATMMEQLKKILKQVFTAEIKPQLVVFSEIMSDSARKLTKKYLSADFATITVEKKSVQEEPEADEDEESDEPFVIKSNNKSDAAPSSASLLSNRENYTTYQLTATDEIKSVGFVYSILRKCFGDEMDVKANVSKVAFTKDFKSAIFDLSSELDDQLQSNWRDSARIQMGPITELPELDESSMVDNSNSFGNKKFGRGGGGNRNSGRSNGCFKCGKDGHKSFECPEANGGNKSGGGCFNCGKDGHKSFECPEPKKAGGRSSSSGACFNCGKEGHRSAECSEPKKAGGRSGACFNCGQEGHRSADCSEPRKAGGRPGGGERSNACFNCGNDGHKSFECPEPKKGRPSGGAGGRGGGRGGARGGRGGSAFGNKRSFGGNNENGYATSEASNKKIKFDDDDE